jgi:hypothetical protein
LWPRHRRAARAAFALIKLLDPTRKYTARFDLRPIVEEAAVSGLDAG